MHPDGCCDPCTDQKQGFFPAVNIKPFDSKAYKFTYICSDKAPRFEVVYLGVNLYDNHSLALYFKLREVIDLRTGSGLYAGIGWWVLCEDSPEDKQSPDMVFTRGKQRPLFYL